MAERRSSGKKEDAESGTAGALEAVGGPDAGSGEGALATPSSLSREEQARLRQKLRVKYH